MKKYELWFGKDPEDLDGDEWWDVAEDTEGFRDMQVAGTFATDIEDMFWEMYLTIRESPVAMWYWVWIDGVQILSGAIDPGDIEILQENVDVPDWVTKKI